MNKDVTFYVTVLLAVFLSFPAFAAEQLNEGADAGKTLTVDVDEPLNLNFSPSVAGQYITEATTGNEQWYAIVTYHSGGKLFYGSSSDSTVVYKRDRTNTQTFTQAAAPTKPADPTTEETADDIWGVDPDNEGTWYK
jgi:hypothetical protein